MGSHGGQKRVCAGCSGTRVTGGYEPPGVDDWIGLWSSGRTASAPNHRVISLASKKHISKEYRAIALYNLKRIIFTLHINYFLTGEKIRD